MELVTSDVVEKACARIWNMSEQQAFQLSYDLEKQQTVLVAYLTAVDKDILNESEREKLFYLGTLIWQIMLTQNKNLPMINEDTLLECEKVNLKIAALLKETNTISFAEVIKNTLSNNKQPEVYRYIVATLLEEDYDESQIRDEILGILMLDLKTVIDCFDKSSPN